ncbi:hypothetical protein [Luteococcus peritonei]|uniref:Acyl-CoA:diacylglycerol acyltransferase n=1 Tax=Luteococcus peritonei TaxID=88874 RepID=A0ABW4RST9_9ACTN
MGISRRQLLGLGAGACLAGGAGVGYGIVTDRLPGRVEIGYKLQLDGGEVPRPEGPTGRMVTGSFRSEHRPGVPEPYAVSLPPGHEAKGLPVVVVLHGWGDDHRFCFEQVGMDVMQAAMVADGAQPYALASLDGEHSYWHRRADGVDWARLVSEGLLGELGRLGLDTARLGLIGWSMGGYGALRLAAEELHGAVRAVGSMATAIYADWDDAPQKYAFDDEADYAANNLNDKLDRLQGLPVHLACGINDHYITRSRWLADQIHPEQTMFQLGDHTVRFWRKASPDQLRFIADRL